MQLQMTKLILALTVGGLLSACGSSKIEQSPDKMVRAGMQRMMKEDNQYNFSGTLKLDVPNQVNADIADKNSDVIEHNASDAFDVDLDSNSDEEAEVADERDFYKKQMKSLNRVLNLLSKSFTIPFTGAVDMPKGRVEVIPELRYENKNALVSYKFPTYIDFNNLAVYVDASAITNISDIMNEQSNPTRVVGDRYLQVAVPQERLVHLPVEDLLKSLPKSVDDGYAAIDANAFTKVDVDEFGKNLEAKYQVRLNSNYAMSLKYDIAMLKSISESLKQAAAKAGSDSKYQPQDYAVLQNVVDGLTAIYTGDDNGRSGVPAAYFIQQLKNNSSPIIYNFYLDSKGRITGMRTEMEIPLEKVKEFKQAIKMDYRIKFDYTGSPKFTMQPTPQNSVNIGSSLGLF